MLTDNRNFMSGLIVYDCFVSPYCEDYMILNVQNLSDINFFYL